MWIKFPKKKSSSVKTDKQVTLLLLYTLAISTGSYSLIIIPADGLAFLISAIIENFLFFILFLTFSLKSIKVLLVFISSFSEASEIVFFRFIIFYFSFL